MAFQRVVNAAQINIVFEQHGINIQNTFYAFMPGGYATADLQELADDLDEAVEVTWLPRIPDSCTYLRVDVRGLDEENDKEASSNTSTATGDDITAPLPNNVTFSIKKQSGLTGRSARGRTYWPAIPSDKLVAGDENTLDPTYITNIVGAVDSIRANIESVGTWQAILVSRFSQGVKRTEGETFPWLSTTFADNTIDTQRGRMA